MSVRIVRLGTPRLPGEGTRIGTVRRPPRGVPKTQFAKQNCALSHTADFSVGCYCENEERCHRSILRKLLREHGARVA